MKLISVLWIALYCYPPPAFAQSVTDGWLAFDECPVLVEKQVEVPAPASGVLATVDVELNQSVAKGQLIANLDSELSQAEVLIAELNYNLAKQLAEDDSEIKHRQMTLEFAETELANRKKKGSSFSGTEMRDAILSVAEARQALIRAQKAKTRAVVEASLQQATLHAAQIRLNRCQLTTKLKGVVTKLLHSPGQWIEAGQPICEIQHLDHLIVDLLVPVRRVDLTSIIGSPVRVEIPNPDGKPTLLSGSVQSHDPRISSQGLVRIHARIANVQRGGNWALLPGDKVRLYVSSEHIDDSLLTDASHPVTGRYISKP